MADVEAADAGAPRDRGSMIFFCRRIPELALVRESVAGKFSV